MKILFLSRLFYPHIGGVEKHVLEISSILLKKGHNVSVITEQYDNNLKTKDKLKGIAVYRIPVANNWFKKFQIWVWLFKNLSLINQADIVHCHDVFFWYLPFRFLFPSKKVFTTFHGYEGYPLKSKDILVHKLSEKLSNGNICIGDFIRKWYGAKPTYVSYGGVNVSEKRKAKSENQVERSAVFVGRLDEQTGFLTYLEAVRRIREKFPNFKFTVFGDGKFRNKIGKNIDFRGFVKNPEKELPKFNFIFASRYLSILEAMAARRPVVAAYDNPVKEDYLKMSPFINYVTIVNSADKVAEKVMYLLNNPDEAKNMIENSFNWVKNQTWENVTKDYLMIWNK